MLAKDIISDQAQRAAEELPRVYFAAEAGDELSGCVLAEPAYVALNFDEQLGEPRIEIKMRRRRRARRSEAIL